MGKIAIVSAKCIELTAYGFHSMLLVIMTCTAGATVTIVPWLGATPGWVDVA